MLDFLKQTQFSLKSVQNAIKQLPLPDKIKAITIYKRYKDIRKIQEEMKNSVKQVEKKYLTYDEPLLTNISKLVMGQKDIQMEELKDLQQYLDEQEINQVSKHLKSNKIIGYWNKVLNNSPVIKDQIGKQDQSLLNSIENIQVIDQPETDNFTIVFTIAENQFIHNLELSKKFSIKNDQPIKSQGTQIQWKGKNLTVKQVKKKQKSKKTGQSRVITKTVPTKSFFNFFNSVQEINKKGIQANEQELQKQEKLEKDFQMGGILVDEVLPYSLEYYLGVQHDQDQNDEDDQNNNDSDQDQDDEKNNRKKKKSKSKSKSKGKNKKETQDKKAQEKVQCKQQ